MAVAPIALPGGVADPPRRTGYVAGAGSVQSLALRDGTVGWRRALDGRPVLATNDAVVVLHASPDAASGLQLAMLDPRDGAVRRESEPIAVPTWADVGALATGSTATFRYDVQVDGATLTLRWEASAAYRGGAAPPPHVEAAARRATTGTARVDLATGAVATEADVPPPSLPALQASGTDDVTFSYRRGASDAWSSDPWPVDDALVAIVGDASATEQTLRLQRWSARTGTADPPIALAAGQALVVDVTPDGRHVLVHSEAASSDAAPWWLFRAPSGARVATVPYAEGAREPCLLDGTLYYLLDRPGGGTALRAVDVASGRTVWEHPLSSRVATPRPPLRQ